jgi:hypothetical protein
MQISLTIIFRYLGYLPVEFMRREATVISFDPIDPFSTSPAQFLQSPDPSPRAGGSCEKVVSSLVCNALPARVMTPLHRSAAVFDRGRETLKTDDEGICHGHVFGFDGS